MLLVSDTHSARSTRDRNDTKAFFLGHMSRHYGDKYKHGISLFNIPHEQETID